MKFSFTKFTTVDHLDLVGFLYEPETYTDTVAIFLHGNGGSEVFSSHDKYKVYAELLTQKGIACSFFNNRGSGFITKYKYKDTNDETVRIYKGMTFELIEECVADIDAAIRELKIYGYSRFILIGHSTGATKAVAYNYLKRDNIISKFILAEGADDTGLFYDALGEDKFKHYLDMTQKKIDTGNGTELITEPILGMWYSCQSLYDTINPEGLYNLFPFYEAQKRFSISKKELFRELKEMPERTAFIYADNDGFSEVNSSQKINLVREFVKKEFSSHILVNTDHGFEGKEIDYANLICEVVQS